MYTSKCAQYFILLLKANVESYNGHFMHHLYKIKVWKGNMLCVYEQCLCNEATHTMSQMIQVPSELADTHSLSSLLILIQVTVALCFFRVSSSRWPRGCSSQTHTCNRWIQIHSVSHIFSIRSSQFSAGSFLHLSNCNCTLCLTVQTHKMWNMYLQGNSV